VIPSKEPEVMENLIRQSQKGNMTSFRDLIIANQRFVFTVAFKVLGDEESAKEVTQECFIKVWKNISLFNFKNKFTTWLYKIAINICYDKLREKRRRNKFIVNYDDSEAGLILHYENDISRQMENKELAKQIEYVSNGLPAKQRIVFSLRDLQGFSTNEVVEITGMSEASVKTNLAFARRAVKDKLIKQVR
jgi:RNA polymerase sigma-70 factor (ECF subfamily)